MSLTINATTIFNPHLSITIFFVSLQRIKKRRIQLKLLNT